MSHVENAKLNHFFAKITILCVFIYSWACLCFFLYFCGLGGLFGLGFVVVDLLAFNDKGYFSDKMLSQKKNLMVMDKIMEVVKGDGRNRLVFLPEMRDDFVWTDLGYELAQKLKPYVESSAISLIARDLVDDILSEHVYTHAIYGTCVAIFNINILFEPELRLDVRSIFEKQSQGQLFVISDGYMENDIFRLFEHDDRCCVDLYDINYLNITN